MQLDRGRLIVFEGIDGTGKSTQCKLLANYFDQLNVPNVTLAEPTKGVWGIKIRKLLNEGRQGVSREEELQWFINDRKEDTKLNIQPALSKNKVVLMDRYYYSTAAYQGALGFKPEKIILKNESFAPIPDRVLIFVNSAENCLERIESSRHQKSAFEKIDYLKKVQDIFKSFNGPNIRFIDSFGSISSIQEKILSEIRDLFNFDCK